MRRIEIIFSAIALLVVASCVSQAATVTGNVITATGNPAVRSIRFVPPKQYQAFGRSTVICYAVPAYCDTNGDFSVTIQPGGFYNAMFGNDPDLPPLRVLIPVGDTNTYTLNQVAQLAVNASMFGLGNVTITNFIVEGGGGNGTATNLDGAATNQVNLQSLFQAQKVAQTNVPAVAVTATTATNLVGSISAAQVTNLPNQFPIAAITNVGALAGQNSVTLPQLPGAVITNRFYSGAARSNVLYANGVQFGTFDANNNLAFGLNTVLPPNGSSVENFFFGNGAGQGPILSGSWNVDLGGGTGFSLTNGDQNTFIGGFAGSQILRGFGNVAIGYDSLGNNLLSTNNIAIGPNSGSALNNQEYNDILIGSPGMTGESGVIRIGDPSQHTQAYIAGQLNANGAGVTNAPAQTLFNDTNALWYANSAGVWDLEAREYLKYAVNDAKALGCWQNLQEFFLLDPRFNPQNHFGLRGNPFTVSNEQYYVGPAGIAGFWCQGTNYLKFNLPKTLTNFTVCVTYWLNITNVDFIFAGGGRHEGGNGCALFQLEDTNTTSGFVGQEFGNQMAFQVWASPSGTNYNTQGGYYNVNTNCFDPAQDGQYDSRIPVGIPIVETISGGTNGITTVFSHGAQAWITRGLNTNVVFLSTNAPYNQLIIGGADTNWHNGYFFNQTACNTNAYCVIGSVSVWDTGVIQKPAINEAGYKMGTDVLRYNRGAVDFQGSSLVNFAFASGTVGSAQTIPQTNSLANIFAKMNPDILTLCDAAPGSLMNNYATMLSKGTNVWAPNRITLLNTNRYPNRWVESDGPYNDAMNSVALPTILGYVNTYWGPYIKMGIRHYLIDQRWDYVQSYAANMYWKTVEGAILTNFNIAGVIPIAGYVSSNVMAASSQDNPPVHPNALNQTAYQLQYGFASLCSFQPWPYSWWARTWLSINSGTLVNDGGNSNMNAFAFSLIGPNGENRVTQDGMSLTNLNASQLSSGTLSTNRLPVSGANSLSLGTQQIIGLGNAAVLSSNTLIGMVLANDLSSMKATNIPGGTAVGGLAIGTNASGNLVMFTPSGGGGGGGGNVYSNSTTVFSAPNYFTAPFSSSASNYLAGFGGSWNTFGGSGYNATIDENGGNLRVNVHSDNGLKLNLDHGNYQAYAPGGQFGGYVTAFVAQDGGGNPMASINPNGVVQGSGQAQFGAGIVTNGLAFPTNTIAPLIPVTGQLQLFAGGTGSTNLYVTIKLPSGTIITNKLVQSPGYP